MLGYRSDIYIPLLTGKPSAQQRSTIRSVVLNGISSRQRSAISGHPLLEL